MREFDAIIIGAGQAGPSLAERLTGAGMTVAFVERKLFGGTCVQHQLHADEDARRQRLRRTPRSPRLRLWRQRPHGRRVHQLGTA
jgi:choline dehydrogenase-like flavoprotein